MPPAELPDAGGDGGGPAGPEPEGAEGLEQPRRTPATSGQGSMEGIVTGC